MSNKLIKNNPYVYSYGIESDKSKLISNLCSIMSIHYSQIDVDGMKHTVKEIIDNTHNNINITYSANEPEILIFNELTSGKLDEFLAMYNSMQIAPVGLKAVVTETNVRWTLRELTSELIRERAAFLLNSRK